MIGTSILKELRRPLPVIHRKSVLTCCKAEFAFFRSSFSFMSIRNSQDSSLSGSGGGGVGRTENKITKIPTIFSENTVLP